MLNRLNMVLITGSLIVLFLSLVECGRKSTQPQQFFYPDSNISFTEHIHPIFIRDCAFTSGCHNSANPANGLDLETLNPTFMSNEIGPVIEPNVAENSPLYLILLGPYGDAPRMPRDSGPLADEKIQAIKIWINEGASINN